MAQSGKKTNKNELFRALQAAFPHTIPVLAGYVFLGFAFGLLVRTGGLPFWLAPLMSLFIYSGSLEFAAIPLLVQPFAPLSAWIFGVMISARHLFYGLPMLERYRKFGGVKPFLIFGLTDETFSLLTSTMTPEGISDKWFCFFVTLLDYFYWNLGTLLGSLGGGLLQGNFSGMDFALTALFVVLFLEQLKNRSGRISGFAGVAASFAAWFLFGKDKLVLGAMGFILLILLAGRRVVEHDEH